jgi:exosortase
MSRKRQSIDHRNSNQAPAGEAASAVSGVPEERIGRSWLIAASVLLFAAFLWAYWPTLVEMVGQWIAVPDYSHGFLVVPLAAFFLWSKRAEFPRGSLRPDVLGILLMLLASALRIAAGWFFLLPIDGWTIPLWVAGAVWALLGRQSLRWSLPAIVFLWFMIPIPFAAEGYLSVPLQALTTKLSTAGLVMLGQSALSEGNTIWLGDHQLFIEEACSGLRIFVGIFALAFAFALFSRWSWWQRALAPIAALPIAIVANVARVIVTGLLFEYASSDATKHVSHDLSGFIMIPFAAALLWLFLVYANRLFPEVQVLPAVVTPVARR